MAPFYPTILKSRAFTAKSLFFSHIDLWIVGVLALGLVLVLPVADAVFVACLANIVYAAAIAVSRYNLISLSKDVLGLDPHQIYYLRYSLDAVLTPEWLDKNWKTVLANYSALLADFGESLKDSKQPVAAKVIIPKTPMTQLKSRRNDGLVDQVSSSLRAVFTEEPKAPRNDIFSDSSHSRNSSAVPDILLAKSNNASCRNSKDAFHLSALKHLTIASQTLDKYGIVQLDVPRVLEALVRCHSAIEDYIQEKQALKQDFVHSWPWHKQTGWLAPPRPLAVLQALELCIYSIISSNYPYLNQPRFTFDSTIAQKIQRFVDYRV